MTVTAPQKTTHGVRARWKQTGWQGVTVRTPSEWNLVAFSGDRRAGSFRLDNGEPGERAAVGLEVRWLAGKGKTTDADIDKRLAQYFAGIARTAKKQKTAADTKSKVLTGTAHPERMGERSFTWHAGRAAQGRIWHCTECGRTVIAQVVGGDGGSVPSAAPDVLASLECHAGNDQWQAWSLYDLQTHVPEDFDLSGKPQLMNIYVQLPFVRGRTLDTVTVEQWGVASVQLRGAYLDQWFRTKNAAQEPALRYASTEGDAQGHPALVLTGRRTGLTYWLGTALPQLLKLQRPATYFSACLWECPDSNKVYCVQSFSRQPSPDLVAEIVARTPCHGADA